jgi:hypothetical protein
MKFIHNILLIALTLLSCNVSNAFYLTWKFKLIPWIVWGDTTEPDSVTPNAKPAKRVEAEIRIEYLHHEGKHGMVTAYVEGTKQVIGLIDMTEFARHAGTLIKSDDVITATLLNPTTIVIADAKFNLIQLPFTVFMGNSDDIYKGASYLIANNALYLNSPDGITRKLGNLPSTVKKAANTGQPTPDKVAMRLGNGTYYYFVKSDTQSNNVDNKTYDVYIESPNSSRKSLGQISYSQWFKLHCNINNPTHKKEAEWQYQNDLNELLKTFRLKVEVVT